MPKWMKFALLGLLLLLVAAIPLAMIQPDTASDTGSIGGLITDEMGPVAGAVIEAHLQVTGAFAHAESDASGHYHIENLRPGHYSLWVQADKHDSVWVAQVTVDRGVVAHEDVFVHRTHLPTPTSD
ncbi:MAG TPA: carboxypeptidase-like regulatory domain-containing protein [Bryobacteraceae bacterium]|nr:carboxypeptidase-like regulatory domain-containing protein [Bryobacteraceae bacterium]